MLFNVEKCTKLLTDSLPPTTLRVFFWLALNLNPQTGFVRTNKKYLAQMLNLDAKSLYRALQWLQDNYIIHQTRCHCYYEFMISPCYVEWGDNKKDRLDEWNHRWQLSNKLKRK